MEAAARSSSLVKKRPRRRSTTAAQIDVLLPAVGIEAPAGSASRRAKPSPRRRRRTAQIGIPSRRAKTVRQHPVSSNHPPVPNWRARSPRDLDDDDDSNKMRARTTDDLLPPCHNWRRDGPAGGVRWARYPRDLDDSTTKLQRLPRPNRDDLLPPLRDWSDLGDGPAGLIAERVLAYDVADYVRFRAVCRPWRQCSADPRAGSGLDRRFHPWRWTMLREKLAAPDRRCFLNTSTSECVKVDIPELRDHKMLALTPEGLLVLLHDHKYIRLLNPLTRHLTELPPLATLVPTKDHRSLLGRTAYFNTYFPAWGSGIADDDSTFVLCLNELSMLGMAKPGDDHWRVLRYYRDRMPSAPIMIAGRFYCVTRNAVKMLKIDPSMPPQLKVAAKLKNMPFSPMADSMYLVNNCGEPMLVHRHCGPLTARNKSSLAYDMYRVDLDTKKLVPVNSLGGAGRALFMGMRCSLTVSLEVFPSGSISADTIYLSFDFPERGNLDVGAYHLADGSVRVPCTLVQPHTLVDCLSLSNTVYRQFII